MSEAYLGLLIFAKGTTILVFHAFGKTDVCNDMLYNLRILFDRKVKASTIVWERMLFIADDLLSINAYAFCNSTRVKTLLETESEPMFRTSGVRGPDN